MVMQLVEVLEVAMEEVVHPLGATVFLVGSVVEPLVTDPHHQLLVVFLVLELHMMRAR